MKILVAVDGSSYTKRMLAYLAAHDEWLGDQHDYTVLHVVMAVPPRAQTAHQQASHLARELPRRIAGQSLAAFRYRDFGSLVSLGEYSTVGNLMGGLIGGSVMVEGYFARLMYLSLYKLHDLALHGFTKVALETLARMITRRTEPRVKLH